MKIIIALSLFIQSIAFSAPGNQKIFLKDILISYNYEVQASGNISSKIEKKFEAIISDYHSEVGADQFSNELNSFIATLPNSDERDQLLKIVDLQKFAPELTLELINEDQLLEKSLTGDSANWSNGKISKYGLVIAILLATATIAAIAAINAGKVDIPDDNSNSITNDDGSVTIYKRFTSFRSDSSIGEGSCNSGTVGTMISTVTNEVVNKCAVDADVIKEGVTSTCSDRVFTEVRYREEQCEVYAEIRMQFTENV